MKDNEDFIADIKESKTENCIYSFLKNPVILYTLFSLLGIIILLYPFYSKGVSPIRYSDGLNQYYYSLCYIGGWLRTVFRNFFINRCFHIPTFDLSLGYGSDIIATLHYYGFGDPINIFSVFFSNENMEYFYVFSLIFKLYISGLSAMYFFRLHYEKENGSLFIPEYSFAALFYVFCGFTILSGIRWISFLTPMISFPLILSGFEKALRNKGCLLLLFSAFYAAASSFYFFYMQCILLIPMGIYIYFADGLTGHRIKPLVRAMIAYALGFVLSLPILLPVITTLLNNQRAGLGSYSILYPSEYYKMLGSFLSVVGEISPDSSVSGEGFGFYPIIIPVLAVAIICFRKNKKELALLAFSVILLLFPWFSHALNGFGYVVHRWIWFLSLVLALITVKVIKECSFLKPPIITVIVIICLVYSLRLYNSLPASKYSAISALMVLATLIIIAAKSHRYLALASLSLMLIMWTGINAWHFFSPSEGRVSYINYVDSNKAYSNVLNSDAAMISEIKNETEIAAETSSIWRYGSYIQKSHGDLNTPSLLGVYGSQFYYSITDDIVSTFYNDLFMPYEKDYRYENLDSRFIMETLAGEKYFAVKDGEEYNLPSSHDDPPVFERDDIRIYENSRALPMAYVFDEYIDYESWLSGNLGERELYLAKSAVLNIVDDDITNALKKTASENIKSYEWDENRDYECSKDEEIYFVMKGVDYTGNWEDAGINVAYNGNWKYFQFNTQKSSSYQGPRDLAFKFTVNEGRYTGPFELLMDGELTAESISIIKIGLKETYKNIEALRGASMDLFMEDSNTFSGNIELDDPGFMQVALPYNKRWKAYVDGNQVKLYQSGGMYIGFLLPPGSHSIRIVYK